MSLAAKRQQQWQSILQLTQQMHEFAAKDAWQKVVEVESARGVQLKAFFSISLDADEAETIAKDIQAILVSDRQIAEAGTRAKQSAMDSIDKIASGRKAVVAYDGCR